MEHQIYSINENFENSIITDIKTIKNDKLRNALAMLYSKRPSRYLLLEKNVKTARIVVRNNNSIFSNLRGKQEGAYYPIPNVLEYLDDGKENVFSHEFLHMASSHYDRKRDIIFTGFNQISDENIFEGFDESYTELLNKRYFNAKIGYIGLDGVASIIEEIVSQQIMEKLYFAADLKDLLIILENKKITTMEFYELSLLIENYINYIQHKNKVIDALQALISVEKMLVKFYARNFDLSEKERTEKLKTNLINIILNVMDEKISEETKLYIKITISGMVNETKLSNEYKVKVYEK